MKHLQLFEEFSSNLEEGQVIDLTGGNYYTKEVFAKNPTGTMTFKEGGIPKAVKLGDSTEKGIPVPKDQIMKYLMEPAAGGVKLGSANTIPAGTYDYIFSKEVSTGKGEEKTEGLIFRKQDRDKSKDASDPANGFVGTFAFK